MLLSDKYPFLTKYFTEALSSNQRPLPQTILFYGNDLESQYTLAKEIARRFYTAAYKIWEKTGTIWENYSPLQCETESPAASPDFCGWSALIPITIYREFL